MPLQWVAEALESRRLLSLAAISPNDAVPFQQIVLDQTPGTQPVVKQLVDVTNSGHLDAVVGHATDLGGGGLYWYQYPASGNPADPWIKHTIDANADVYESARAADISGHVDSHGNPVNDLVVAEAGTIVWYENPLGDGLNPATAPWTKHVIGTITQGPSHDMVLADLDGDGKLDVVMNTAIFFQNSPTSWTRVAAPNYNRTEFGLSFFDSGSGLGAVDLLGTSNGPDFQVGWYENPRDHGGNARTDPWIFHAVGAYGNYLEGYGLSYAAMDVNGDGREDIITAPSEGYDTPDGVPGNLAPVGGLIWWEAPVDRINGTWIEHTIDPTASYVHNIVLGDMNGDGTPDILVFEQEQSAQGRLMIDYNEGGTGQNWLVQTLASDANPAIGGGQGGHNESVGDVNGDGALDILNAPHGYYTQVNPITLFLNQDTIDGIVRPAIGTGPISQTVNNGDPVTFSVAATGTGPLTYQWQLNGQDIAGANASSYTLFSAPVADNGAVFRCIVGNPAGLIPSPGATLGVTVTGNPVAILTPPATITVGGANSQAQTLVVTYIGAAPIDVTSLDNSDLQISGPGFSQLATYVGVDGNTGSVTRVATYGVPAPAGGWVTADNGTYTVAIQASQVDDTDGLFVAAATLGTFSILIPNPALGSLIGSQAAAASSYNLTTLGASDWAHWGRGASAANFDHKTAGGSQISNVTKLGTGASYGGYSDNSRNATWTDGSPTASDTNEHGYIWANTVLGAGYSFTVPADMTSRTLYVYAGGYSSGGTLTAHLSGASAPSDYVATASGNAIYTNLYTITYAAASAGQTLTISYVKTTAINGAGGSVDLIAAALVQNPTPTAPSLTTNPQTQTLTVGQDAKFTAAASGYPVPTVQWLVEAGDDSEFEAMAGQTSTTLDLGPATPDENGNQYEAVFSNGVGSSVITSAATLNVSVVLAAPVVTTNPQNQNLIVGQDASFTAAASGYPIPTVQWMVEAAGSASFSPIGGATSTTLDLGPATLAETGNQYEAVFDNSSGPDATTTAATLTVTPGGSLAGSQATAASSYNLTTLGTSDWAHWGRGAAAGNFDHKASGGSQISNVTKLGTGANYGGYSDTSRNATWTDGTPVGSDTNEHGYIWANTVLGAGYSFTVPASTTTQTLYVYAGGYSSGGTLTAHLSGASAPADCVATASGNALYTNLYTITYAAASAGQTLTISYVKSTNINGTGGSVDLIAAALTGAPAKDTSPPTASVTSAPTLASAGSTPYTLTVTYSDNIAVNASTLGNNNLLVTGTGYSQAATLVSTGLTNGPTVVATYSVPAPAGGWSNASNGTYTIALQSNQVADTSGNFALAVASLGTFTVNIPLPGAGSLTGSQVTAASSYNLTTLGTTDWAHWGTGNVASSFNHKAAGGSQISNVTKLGSGSYGSWYDPSRDVSWTDGTPLSSDAGDSAYIWANNAIGAGYSFTVPAGATVHTLYIYAGGNSSGAALTAHLSDSSAPDVVITGSGTGLYTNLYAITFSAASAGQTLTISYVKSTNINGIGGSVDLIAAALV